jgi:hypothetical protein
MIVKVSKKTIGLPAYPLTPFSLHTPSNSPIFIKNSPFSELRDLMPSEPPATSYKFPADGTEVTPAYRALRVTYFCALAVGVLQCNFLEAKSTSTICVNTHIYDAGRKFKNNSFIYTNFLSCTSQHQPTHWQAPHSCRFTGLPMLTRIRRITS